MYLSHTARYLDHPTSTASRLPRQPAANTSPGRSSWAHIRKLSGCPALPCSLATVRPDLLHRLACRSRRVRSAAVAAPPAPHRLMRHALRGSGLQRRNQAHRPRTPRYGTGSNLDLAVRCSPVRPRPGSSARASPRHATVAYPAEPTPRVMTISPRGTPTSRHRRVSAEPTPPTRLCGAAPAPMLACGRALIKRPRAQFPTSRARGLCQQCHLGLQDAGLQVTVPVPPDLDQVIDLFVGTEGNREHSALARASLHLRVEHGCDRQK